MHEYPNSQKTTQDKGCSIAIASAGGIALLGGIAAPQSW